MLGNDPPGRSDDGLVDHLAAVIGDHSLTGGDGPVIELHQTFGALDLLAGRSEHFVDDVDLRRVDA